MMWIISDLCKSMDHRKVIGEICRIMDGRWGDVVMWRCCGVEGNHDQ